MIGFIGGGNMAEALIKGMRIEGIRDIIVSEPKEERRHYLESTYHVRTTASNPEVIGASTIIILAVKPQNMGQVLDEITGGVDENKTIVSIAAGITLAYLQSKLKTTRLVRVMPNTPALVLEGMSVLSLCSCLPGPVIAPVRQIFMSIGKVTTLPEKQINAVTALSGSGPAFIALFIESMIAAGEALGLSSESARELAIQTLIGTAKQIGEGMSPEKLREMVTSPGGTTAAGLAAFQEKGLKEITISALQSAHKRAEELGRNI
ncbi:MAG TPA: pyrroline-5-carboxylate reductase [Dissulfurispiraceae bacterium]|nr:pyrroline-5-carboxylate reductase [Dissulfurispiraceae bacterium]